MYRRSSFLWPGGKSPSDAYCDEDQRLAILAAHGTGTLFDDPELQGIADLAARICAVPMAMVTMVEKERQVFLTRTGIDARETPRSTSFCAHAMLGSEAMEVVDARHDSRFADNPLVTGDPHIRFYAGQPLLSEEGVPLGALCVIDTIPRDTGLTPLQRQTLEVLAQAVVRRVTHERLDTSARQAVELRERYLQKMIDSVPGIAWSADGNGTFDYVSAQWSDMTGLPAPTRVADWWVALHPDDVKEAMATFENALANGEPFESEWRLRRPDGEYSWFLSRGVRMAMEGGEQRWFGALIDIDRQHRLSDSRDLLANELSHRIKNIFAVVSGLIAIRARNRPEVADFASEVNEAIRALGAAHNYVRPGHGLQDGTLSGLLSDLLAPYGSVEEGRFSIDGPGITIGSRAATPLALIFHELATNSAKYGALSCGDGKVAIHITEEGDEICVDWDENAMSCAAPEREEHEGFGSRLLRMAVEGQLRGSFQRHFTDDGLNVRILFPRESIAS